MYFLNTIRNSLFLCSFLSFSSVFATQGDIIITSNDDSTLQYEYTHVYPISSGTPFVE